MGKIFLVDPDTGFSDALAARLREKGHEVHWAGSATTALGRIRGSGVDLVITEMALPKGASGTDLLRFIQLEMPETSVIIATATADIAAAVEAMQVGAMDYIVKPISLDVLEARISNALERRKLIQDNRNYQVYMERTFRRYISPEVLTVLMSTREIDKLQARQLEASVLFADLRNFTKLTKTWDPQDLLPVLNEHYFQPVTEIIGAHKGTLDKFIGDGIMAVFGAPLPVEDHARQALRAALDVERYLEADRVAGRHPFRVGIGVASGTVTSGNLGGDKRLDFTVLGPAVNRAARLEKLAGAGEVLLDDDTYKLVSPLDMPVRQERAEVKGEGPDLILYKLTPIRKA